MEVKRKSKSIFRSLFVPMIIIMVVQALIFYIAAVYGGIEESLSRNAVEIMSGRMNSRKNEIETVFNNRWTALDDCISALNRQYAAYEQALGPDPFSADAINQIDFLRASGDLLIDALRYSKANGVFLILNDAPTGRLAASPGGEQKYGLCIRDMDQESNYSGREDLLLERAPSSIVDALGCLLDSWWEAKYSFSDYNDGIYYYAPLYAALEHPNSESVDLAYFSPVHQISESDPPMVSYSVPLIAGDGAPYAVLGIELSVNYLSSLLPGKELNQADKGCYVLALHESGTDEYEPVVAAGALYNRCFGDTSLIKRGAAATTGGFSVMGRDGTKLYATEAVIEIYNNNSPFESRQLVLLALVESNSLFSYISHIKFVLFVVSLLSLLLGVAALIVVSRRFAAPITALARKASRIDKSTSDYSLEHIGVAEIDQLVDSIEELNLNASRNSTRTEFFSRMSHDMRTPMNAIISFSSQEIVENADEGAKDDYIKKIHDSGVYLLGLINDVLDMTKIESDKTEIRLSRVQVAQIFDTSISMIEKLAQKKNVTFTTRLELDPELTIMADEQHLSQIVMNLLSNAIKFTPPGGRVSFSAKLSAGRVFTITVADTGVGMSGEFMKKLYTPFAQENDSHEGTGLGLSITKKLVELMNGTIACESEKNKGTTFTLTLPVLPAEGGASASAHPAEAKQEHTDITAFQGKRVMVCEDNAINISIITLLLERVGLKVDVATNGQQGVELFKASKPGTYSAILMDIRMPVMDGLEASKTIRRLHRDDAPLIPIIAMTADAFAEDEQISRAAGMNEHLSKPIDIKKLYATLLRYVI